MIKVELQESPDFLESDMVELAIEKMEVFFKSKNRNQKRYSWPFNGEIDGKLKPYLHNVFYGKCGYCESKIESPRSGTIDRYRPNNGVREKNEYYQDLYWWLTFEWSNLIYSCKECNQYKGNYFPVDGKRVLNENEEFNSENRKLLNPYLDEPNDHLEYWTEERDSINASSEEGNQTIELLRLNRTGLVEGRKKARKKIVDNVDLLINGSSEDETIKNYLFNIYELEDLTEEYLSYKRWVLLIELETTPFLGQILNLDDYEVEGTLLEKLTTPKKSDFSDNDIIRSDYFPIEYIHIKNFKSIDDLRIDFNEDELQKKSWMFLLGENGVGKSSILQAMAIGLRIDRKTVKPLIPKLIKNRKHFAEIVIKERNSENVINTTLTRKGTKFTQTGKFNSNLIGYGSLRLSVDESQSSFKKDTSKVSYENLFMPTRALNDVSKWLKSIYKNEREFFNRIAYSIKQLLPHDNDDTTLSVKGNDIVLGNSESSFNELSDGYRSTITLAIDIMMKLSDSQSDMDKMSGIVLIDELGNQLHPRWQMRIVKQLRSVFPNINFIISTHHPLCLRGADEKEILLLKNIDNQIIINSELPNPASLRIDQILGSEFFGLNSLVDPEIEAKFNRYYCLLAKNDDTTPIEKIEITNLKGFLKNKKQLGNTLREELMYAVIDQLLAEQITFNKDSWNRKKLKDEAIRKVKEIWDTLNLSTDDKS